MSIRLDKMRLEREVNLEVGVGVGVMVRSLDSKCSGNIERF